MIKLRVAFLKFIEMARARRCKGRDENMLARLAVVAAYATGATALSTETQRRAVLDRQSHAEILRWLKDAARLQTKSYAGWFPGEVLCFADDNAQWQREFWRQRLNSLNNADTNPLVQTHFAIVWALKAQLESIEGLMLTPVSRVTAADFDLDATNQPFFATELKQLSLDGAIGKHILAGVLDKVVWKHDTVAYAREKFAISKKNVAFAAATMEEHWTADSPRALRVQLKNTQKVVDVAEARLMLLDQFGFGRGDPCRQYCFCIGDWGLYYRGLKAAGLTVEQGQALVQVRRVEQGLLAPPQVQGVDAPVLVAADARDGVRDVFETSVTLEAFLESKPDADALRAPLLAAGFASNQDLTEFRVAADLNYGTGMKLGKMSKKNVTAMLRWFQKHRDDERFAEYRRPGPAAAAQPPVAQPAVAPPPVVEDTVAPRRRRAAAQKATTALATRKESDLSDGSDDEASAPAPAAAKAQALPRSFVDDIIKADATIRVLEANPKGGVSADRYEKYKKATSVQKFLDLGGSKGDLKNDIERDYVTFVDDRWQTDQRRVDALKTGARPRGAGAKVISAKNGTVKLDPDIVTAVRAIGLQGRQADDTVAPEGWDPLADTARLLSNQARQRYEAERNMLRVRGTDAERRRFAVRWFDAVAEQLDLLERPVGDAARAEMDRYRRRLLRDAEGAAAETRAALEQHAELFAKKISENEAEASRIESLRDALAARRDDVLGREADDAAPTTRDEPDLMWPELLNIINVPGFWHLLEAGGIKVIYKMYWQSLLGACGHRVLRRRGLGPAAEKYFQSVELFYHVYEAMATVLFRAHRRSLTAVPTSSNAYIASFLEWFQAGVNSGDLPFQHYGCFVLGMGLFFRVCKKAVSLRMSRLLYALLLVHMGACSITNKFNQKRQCFLSLLQLISSQDHVAPRLMAATTVSVTGRKFHAVASDAAQEMVQGKIQTSMGSKFNVPRVLISTALADLLRRCARNFGQLSTGEPAATPARGRSIDAQADISQLAVVLERCQIFDCTEVRTSLPSELLYTNEYSLPKKFIAPLDLTKPFDKRNQPILEHAHATAARLLASAGLDEDGAPVELDEEDEEAVDEEADDGDEGDEEAARLRVADWENGVETA